jgi:hypothetical protein
MNLYYIHSSANVEGDVVDIQDGQRRIADYFIWNTNDGKFLKFTKARGKAQEYLTELEISTCDYLDSNISIPIFSQRARDILEEAIPDELEFHEIEIITPMKNFIYFLGKCRKYLKLLNKQASEYRPLTDGSLILSRPAYKIETAEDFFIARDSDESQIFVASQKFVDLCKKNNLKIEFITTTQR